MLYKLQAPEKLDPPRGYFTLVLPILLEVTTRLPALPFSVAALLSSFPQSNKFTRKPLCYGAAVFEVLCYYQEKENGYSFNF